MLAPSSWLWVAGLQLLHLLQLLQHNVLPAAAAVAVAADCTAQAVAAPAADSRYICTATAGVSRAASWAKQVLLPCCWLETGG
jgi:hypothetical protein